MYHLSQIKNCKRFSVSHFRFEYFHAKYLQISEFYLCAESFELADKGASRTFIKKAYVQVKSR
jgi:hypothetical protein